MTESARAELRKLAEAADSRSSISCSTENGNVVNVPVSGLLALLDAAEPVWRPIASAPKDGTRVLVFDPTQSSCDVVITAWFSQGRWQRAYEPTHWQPLPPAPTTPDTTPVKE